MTVFLLTTGDGSDGDEWTVEGIYSTRSKALLAELEFERDRIRPDGSTYRYEAEIEEWEVDPVSESGR